MEQIATLPFHELINIMDIVFTYVIHRLNLSALSVFRLFYTVPMKRTSKNMALIYTEPIFLHTFYLIFCHLSMLLKLQCLI